MNPVLSMCRQTAQGIDFSTVVEILRNRAQKKIHQAVPTKRQPRKSTITPIMYSYCCVGLKDKYFLAFRVRWLGEHESINPLIEAVREDVEQLAKREHWQAENKEKLIHLAVLELYSPNKKIPYKDKLEYLDVSKDTFYRKHNHYINHIFNLLNDYTNVAFSHIKKHS